RINRQFLQARRCRRPRRPRIFDAHDVRFPGWLRDGHARTAILGKIQSRSVSRRVGPAASERGAYLIAYLLDALALKRFVPTPPLSLAPGPRAPLVRKPPPLPLPPRRPHGSACPRFPGRLRVRDHHYATERISFVCLLVHMKILAGSKLPERVSGHYWDT